MVNPKTGKVLGADEETNRPTPHLPPWFGACRCTKGKREPRDSQGFARVDHERKSRDHGALDVPILSQSINQARRGSRKRPDPPLDTTGPEGGYSKRLRMLEHQLAGWAVCARALRECLIGGKASVVSSLPLLLSEHIGSGL